MELVELDESKEVPEVKGHKRPARIWSIRYWMDKLSDRKSIVKQIMFHLFISHIHYPFKCYYHGTSGSPGRCLFSSSGSDLQDNNQTDSDRDHKADATRKLAGRRKRQAVPLFKLTPDSELWDWQGVQDRSSLVRRCEYFSLICLIYAFFKSILGIYGDQLNDESTKQDGWLLMGLPANCFLLGRFIFQPSLEAQCCAIFAFFHLCWRYTQRYLSQPYMLAPFIFLLQTNSDLDRFYKIMAENKHENYLTSSSPHVNSIDEPTIADCSGLMQRHSNFFHQMIGRNQQDRESHKSVSVHESFFRHIMCYEVHINGKIYYKLRPNRTWQSRNSLIHHLAASTLVSACWMLWQAIVATPVIILFILSDVNYARLYPGCSPELSRNYEGVRYGLVDWYEWVWFAMRQSFLHIETHRLLAFVFDLVESIILYYDSAAAILFASVMAYFLNYDILLYWHHLHAKLEDIVARVKLNKYNSDRLQPTLARQGSVGPTMWQSTAVARVGNNIVTSVRTTRIGRQSEAQLESDINDFQFELIDFFAQVEKADKLVSNVLTFTLIIWIFNLTFVSFYWVGNMAKLPHTITFFFVVGLIVLTVASRHLLKLRRSCMKSYKLISTLMAYDQTGTKEHFLKLLEFYTHRDRTTYTLFQRYPYTATTYISMAGWSLSCYFIIKSLFYDSGFWR